MSNGAILLEGGAEFGGRMEAPDRAALQLAGGLDVPVAIIPAAAAPDNNHQRAGANGERWFRTLGVKEVASLALIDRRSADDEEVVSVLSEARLIYLLGGFPRHLAQSLAGSRAWQAVVQAYHAGAVVGGSSAGAMVLCEHYDDPYEGKLLHGLNLVPNACVIPHHNRSGKSWAARLRDRLPDAVLIGIDEQTGMLGTPGEGWTVHGAGAVTLYRNGVVEVYNAGNPLTL